MLLGRHLVAHHSQGVLRSFDNVMSAERWADGRARNESLERRRSRGRVILKLRVPPQKIARGTPSRIISDVNQALDGPGVRTKSAISLEPVPRGSVA